MKTQVKIKICGLRTSADVAAVNAALPEYAGFIFVPMRRRYIAPAQAAMLCRQLDPRIRPVGVFVDARIEEILEVLTHCPIDMVQLHGAEDDDYIATLRAAYRDRFAVVRKRSRDLCIVKAFRVEDVDDIRRAEASVADEILLDHGTGGTGERFDWTLLQHGHRRFFLAGGLTPDDVEDAIRVTQPYAVDVSSSLETDGRKDPEKIRRFVSAVRRSL